MHRAWLVFIGCCCLQAGALGLALNSAGVFFAPICADLGFAQGGIALYLTLYSWSTCVGMLLVARLFPRIDTRITMTTAAVIVVCAMGLMGTYTELWQWYISGVLYGLAGSFLFIVPAPILLANWFHKKVGTVTGIAMAFSGIGAAVFSPLLTSLIETIGWRGSYMVAAAIMAVLVLPFTLFVFRFKPEQVGLKPYGWEEETAASGEEVVEHGATLRRALPTVAFAALFVFAGLCSCYGAYTTQLPTFAVSIDLGAMVGATLVSAAMVGNITSKITMGFVSDAIGVVPTTFLQIGLIACGFLLLAFVQIPWALYLGAFLFGFQNNLVSVSVPMLIKDVFGTRSYTEIFSFVRIGTGIIGGLGLAFVASSYDAFGTFTPAFLVGIAITAGCALCVLVAVLAKKRVVWDE